jgi:hypothetical protein
MRLRQLLLIAWVCVGAGCADETIGSHPAEDAGSDADADAGDDAGDDLCPDPEDPRVSYVSSDPSACVGVELACSGDQNGFFNACGCGCIDKGDPLCPEPGDPTISWVSHDPAECSEEPPGCALGEIGFSNSCGCGCKLDGG